MREIKFRGRDIETGEWRYGFYYIESAPLVAIGKTKKDKYYIVFPGFADWNMPRMQQSEVCPGSIGEFTGLKDKNGKEIYEGDVLHQDNYSDWVVIWQDCGFHIYNQCNPGYFFTLVKSDREVIGNIYENKALLTEIESKGGVI